MSAWMRAEARKLDAIAQHLFPNAVLVGASPGGGADGDTLAAEQTRNIIMAGATAAGATLAVASVSCRVDFAVREGSTLRLYQVVSRCVDLENHRRDWEFKTQWGSIRQDWRGQLEGMALKVWIAQQVWPTLRILPFFIAPIRGASVNVEGLHAYFEERDGKLVITDPHVAEQASSLLRFVGVGRECAPLVQDVPGKVAALEAALKNPLPPAIGYRCKKCEYKVPESGSGFARCWGKLAEVTPSMFSVGYMYFIQDADKKPVADRLVREGRVSLHDIPLERVTGVHARRQLIQIEGTKSGEEYLDPALAEKLDGCYPQSFLDIETICTALPIHAGGKVNGLTCFQFSVHRRTEPDGELTHHGWLNTTQEDPNRTFLSALRSTLGDTGVVYVWTAHEETSFDQLLSSLIDDGDDHDDLQWLKQFLASGRIVDLHQLCFDHYWHPHMAGRTSIKVVLHALWSVDSPVKQRIPFNEFPPDIDPYSVLKSRGGVADGVGAMAAYLRLMSSDTAARSAAAEELWKYCAVDSLAMVFVYDFCRWRIATRARRERMMPTG